MKDLTKLTKEAKLLLLIIIEKNGSIDDLYNLGYEYVQITNFLKDEIANNNASFENGKLLITEKGLKEKNELSKELKIYKSDRVVRPQLSKKDSEIFKLTDIFIPSEDDLMF